MIEPFTTDHHQSDVLQHQVLLLQQILQVPKELRVESGKIFRVVEVGR